MGIHPTAIVAKAAEIDPSAEIGPYVVIEGPVVIAADVKVYAHAYLAGWTHIGEKAEIHPHAVIGHLPQDLKFRDVRTYCRIGRNTIIREGATVHRGTEEESTTLIGDHCFLMHHSHVGHNCAVGDHVILVSGCQLSGHVRVGDRAFLGGCANVHQFVRIGELAMIGGLSRLTMDVPPFMMIVERDQCVGVNRVGMRRAGIPREDCEEIRAAHRLMYRSGKLLATVIDKLESTLRTPSGRTLVEFLKAPRKRPICFGRRHGQAAGDAAENS